MYALKDDDVRLDPHHKAALSKVSVASAQENRWTLAAIVLSEEFEREGLPLIITSANDSEHMEGSKHYEGEAWDLRTWRPGSPGVQIEPQRRRRLAKRIADRLGPDWDVLAKSTHIHVEWDPKEE
ncbi:MAG: hypothetical protein AAFR11_05675 [Pseudomonadota bacterium]